MSGSAIAKATKVSRPSAETSSEDQEGGEDDQVAMREIDQPHDAEDQRQAGRVERVEPAEQDALDDACRASSWRQLICSHPEIGGVDGVAGELGRAAGERHASLLEAVDAVGDGERLHDVLLDDDDCRAFRL